MNNEKMTSMKTVLSIAFASAVLATPISAQLTSASAATVGLANSHGALATGFGAVGANPARLGLKSNPSFSLALPTVRAGQGTAPIGLGDVNRYAGEVIPHDQKVEWLNEITRDDGLHGGAQIDASALSFNVGRIGFQHSTYGVGGAQLTPDAAELLLFGNSGLSGQAGDFALDGSTVNGAAFSSFGLAFGMPVSSSIAGEWSVGATMTYTIGHGVAVGTDLNSQVGSDPIEVDLEFPVLYSSDGAFSQGSGMGMDLGVAYESAVLSLSVVAKSVFNTFSWELDGLEYLPGQAFFDTSESSSDFEARPGSEAPAELLESLNDFGFDPTLELGAAFRVSPGTTLVVETKRRMGDGIEVGPKTHLGVGAERGMTPFLVLRSGLAAISDGYRLGGGATVILAGVNVTGGWAYQGGAVGAGNYFGFGLTFNAR
ncbi:MAG: DUF5723 family protein [Longimicrobiales bacterium]